MGIFDDTLSAQGVDPSDTAPFTLPTGVYFKDADTFVTKDGTVVRLQGANAYETQKTGRTADSFQAADIGADSQLKIAHKVASEKGYNIPVLTGKKDAYGRTVGDLADADGNLLSTFMVGNRIVDTMIPDENILRQRAVMDLDKARDASYGLAPSLADKYLTALNAERHEVPLIPKLYANTAKDFGASLDKRGNSSVYTGAAIQQEDENYKGDARSNFKTGLEGGYNSMMQGAWNGLDMLGTATGSEYLKSVGEANSGAYQSNLENLPNLRNGEAFDENGKWQLDSFSKVADYSLGTAASSAPQMLLSFAALAAAPVTYGVSLAAPAVIFAGQTWQNQEAGKKNVEWALASGVTQAVIESLGVGKLTGSIFHKATQKEVVGALMKKGYTKEAAEQAIILKSQKALKDISDAGQAVMAKDALEAVKQAERVSMRSIPKAGFGGFISETPTEVAQEITQYFGEKSGFNLPTTEEEQIKLKNRLLNAGVGGAFLGTGFGAGGRAVSNLVTRPDGSVHSSDVELRKKVMDTFGYIPTAREVADNAANTTDQPSLDSLAEGERLKRQVSGIGGSIRNWAVDKGLSSLVGKWSDTIKGKEEGGTNTNALWSLLGSSRVFGGGSVEEQQALIHQTIQNKFGSPDELRASFGNKTVAEVSSLLNAKDVKSTLESLVNIMNGSGVDAQMASTMIDIGGRLGAYSQHKEAVVKYASRLNDTLKAYNEHSGDRLDISEFMELRPINRTAIQRHPGDFANLLVKHLQITPQEADEAVTRLTNDADMNLATDPFDDLFNSNPNAGAVKSNLQGVLNDPANAEVFAKYLNTNPVENAYALAAKGAASFVNKQLIGKDGYKLAALLNAGVREKEISPERASFVAKELQDWLDMRRGKYHEITNKYAKGALSVVNFLSTVSSLPLAAISSTVEFSQVYRNLTLPQSMKATRHILKAFGAEIGTLIHSMGSGPRKGLTKDYRETLFAGGFSAEGDIGKRNDIVTGYFQSWTEGFFKMTGLTSITNIQRYAKLSIGADAINHWLEVVRSDDKENPTQKAKDAREHLIRIGVDVDFLTTDFDMNDPELGKKIEHQLNMGVHNFVTEAVIHPTKMNRPKFYNDPYLQLFTQFQGYVSTFTANILPRLLTDLRKNGSTDQINAASAIAMMFAFALFALYIKDMIKYGESPPPWLKDDGKFQRYIGQVGLLGAGQRLWDAVSPIVPESQRKQSVLAQAYNQVSDQAPALAYINKINAALSAPDGSQISKTVRTLPVFGTSPAFAKYLQKELGAN